MNLISKIKAFFSKGTETSIEEQKTNKFKTGFVKFFNRSKGYGFIHSKDLSSRVFVHVSELEDQVKVGDRVKFRIEKNAKGLMAKEVEVV